MSSCTLTTSTCTTASSASKRRTKSIGCTSGGDDADLGEGIGTIVKLEPELAAVRAGGGEGAAETVVTYAGKASGSSEPQHSASGAQCVLQ